MTSAARVTVDRTLRVALLAVSLAVPFWLLQSALRAEAELVARPFTLTFRPTSANLAALLRLPHLGRLLINSVTIAAGTALTTLAVSIPLAAGLARWPRLLSLRARLALSLAYTMYPIGLLIPWFRVAAAAGLVDTRAGVVAVHTAIVTPLVVLLLEGAFRGVPASWRELALMWGLGPWGTLRHLILPATRGVVAVAGLIAFALSWREYLFAFLLSYTDHTRTLVLQQVTLAAAEAPPRGLLAVFALLAMLPAAALATTIPWLARTLSATDGTH